MPDIYSTSITSRLAFIKAISGELEGGGGFIPLVGAGLSAASGIPVTPELHRYLLHCIWKVLNPSSAWSPERAPYPAFSDLGKEDPSKAIRQIVANSNASVHCDAIA